MKVAPINKGFLLIGVTIVFILILVTYIPWEHSNYNGLPNSFLSLIPIKVFEFLTFPALYAVDYFEIVNNNILLYLFIILLNITALGLIIERLLTVFIEKLKAK